MAISNFEEKRRFPRIRLSAPLRYQIRGFPGFNDTLSQDISLGGISFNNNKFIPPQTTVAVEINILSRILRAIGKVSWSMPTQHSDKYKSGVEFLELPLEEANYLRDYIAMQSGNL